MSTTSAIQYFFHHAPCLVDENGVISIDTKVALKLMGLASDLHSTTRYHGSYETVTDIHGHHITLSYKSQVHLEERTHITCHAYSKGPNNYDFEQAIFTRAKPDPTTKRLGGPTWPDNATLWKVPDDLVALMDVAAGGKVPETNSDEKCRRKQSSS
ncbi:hypothetical protein E4U37_006205 [Claviceps purpurea]|nr:hypothetical protein E4U37_006205 [Claviceps purpurea]